MDYVTVSLLSSGVAILVGGLAAWLAVRKQPDRPPQRIESVDISALKQRVDDLGERNEWLLQEVARLLGEVNRLRIIIDRYEAENKAQAREVERLRTKLVDAITPD